MATRKRKVLPARKSEASRDDDSLLIRSAESLGRVIGSLQRQMQVGTKRVSTLAERTRDALPGMPRTIDASKETRSSGTKRSTAGKTDGSRGRETSRKASPARAGAAGSRGRGRRKAAGRTTAAARKSAAHK